jgi:hypothetical protein
VTAHITRMAVGWEAGSFSAFAGAGASGEWGNVNSLSVVDAEAVAARTGAYGLRLHPTAGSATQSREFNLSQEFIGRFYFKFPTLPSGNAHIFFVGNGTEATGAQIRFRQSDNKLICVSLDGVGAVTATAEGPAISANTWYRIDFRKATDATFYWQVDGVIQTNATASSAFNRVNFGTNTAQTFDLYVDDFTSAYSADDGGDTGATLAAEYPIGAGYCVGLRPISTTSPDSSDFSVTDASAIGSSHQVLDNDPIFGAPGVRQDVVDAANYMEYGLTQLAANEVPNGISPLAEGRTSGGGTGNASFKITKDGSEVIIVSGNAWINGPHINVPFYLPGDSQTTKWTRTQVNAAVIRWGYSDNVSNPPIIGGFLITVDVSTTPGPGSAPASDAPRGRSLGMYATIDGRPVEFLDWQATVEADWGERTLTGKVLREVTWAEQGSSVELWRGDGTRLWSGELTQDPKLEGPLLSLRAQGYAEWLAANRTRMFYRTDGASLFVDAEEDPHGYNESEKYDLIVRQGMLKWTWGDGDTTFQTGDVMTAVIWIEGGLITRYTFLADPSETLTNWEVRTVSATGPSGAFTALNDHSLNVASATYAVNIDDPTDLFGIRVRCNSGPATPASRRKLKLTAIKIYGRTTDDEFTASEVAVDVAAASGVATDRVQANGLSVLPLDWTENHPALLDYLVELTGGRWMVRGDGLHFGPYERTWEVSTEDGANAEVEPERRFNRVVVPYRSLSGRLRETSPAVPETDPYPGEEFTHYAEELEDPQPDAELATALAATTVEHLAAARITGRVDVAACRLEGSARDPIEIEPGDLLNITDLRYPPQRIKAVTYAKDRLPVVELGEVPFDPMQVIRTFQRDEAGKRKRRRR